jgi:3-oxoisoapionate decarboxylase
MRIGVDSYSYHRLLGEVRPGEDDPGERFAAGSLDVVREAGALGVDAVALETCFLPSPSELDVNAYRAVAGSLELVLSWGHHGGLEYGTRPQALAELHAWIALAPLLGARIVRLEVASPWVDRPLKWREPTASALAEASTAARAAGVALALENHADLRTKEIAELLADVADQTLGVCLDTANALRVGDDPVAAAELLGDHTIMCHLKDVAAIDAGVDPRTGPRSVPYGAGVISISGVLEALENRAFDGLLCVELGHLGPGAVDERELVAQGVGWLRRWMEVDHRGCAGRSDLGEPRLGAQRRQWG